MASLFERFRSMFRGNKKPQRVRIGEGHRGIAARDLAMRQRRQARGREPYSWEEIKKWETLSVEEVDDFVNGGQPLFVHSSNVVSAQYYPIERKMLIQFKDGRYMYSNVSEQEALNFAQAQSKGAFVWDTFRVRGSKTAHRKPYAKVG